MITSGKKKGEEVQGTEERGVYGPLPATCLGAGAANARVTKEARASNFDMMIFEGKECGLGLKAKEQGKGKGGGETAMSHSHVLYPRLARTGQAFE